MNVVLTFFLSTRHRKFHIFYPGVLTLLFSFLASPLAYWSVSIYYTNSTSIRFTWQNLQILVSQQISHYFIDVKNSYGISVNNYIVPGNTTSHVLSRLSPDTEYRLCVIGVNFRGNAYNSTERTAWTDEAGMCRKVLWTKLVWINFLLCTKKQTTKKKQKKKRKNVNKQCIKAKLQYLQRRIKLVKRLYEPALLFSLNNKIPFFFFFTNNNSASFERKI